MLFRSQLAPEEIHILRGVAKAMIETAGFSRVTYTNMTFGVVALHVGVKV